MAKKRTKPKYSVLGNVGYVFSLIWEFDKSIYAALLITSAAGVLLPFYGIYLPKLVISFIEQQVLPGEFFKVIGSLAAIAALVYFLDAYFGAHRYWHTNMIRNDVMWKAFLKTLYCDYKIIESAQGQTKYQKALMSIMNGDWSGINRMITAISGLSIGILGFSLYTGVLSGVNPLIVVLLTLASAINYLFIWRTQNYAQSRKDEKAKLSNKVAYIQRKSGEAASGKDVRLYAMRNWFLKLHDRLLKEIFAIEHKEENRTMLSALVNAALILLRDGFAYAYLIFEISNGRMAVSEFIFYCGAIAGFSQWITQMVKQAGMISQASSQISDIRAFFDMDVENKLLPPQTIPPDAPYTIEFRDVCFRYGESEADALSHLNLTVKAGEKIAIVGINGAGKTTLVKLLCGLYRVDSGAVLINGVDISAVDREKLFELFSVVFQEALIAPFTVAENIALKTEKKIDREAVTRALKRAGLTETIAATSGGIDAVMTKILVDDGLILSGGQQQKLLLARALYKNAPILILDEPSAALDPIAESELYEQYHALTQGKTSLYISHRLASTRFCDRVILLSGGRVAEQGTHEELVAQGGEYARMFEIQSHYYKRDVTEKEAFV